MESLREGIKKKYEEYHKRNRDKYPALPTNTNRANYLPLWESFHEEFFTVRGLDRKSKSIHIPSTSTLAQIFRDDTYQPGPRILNTCLSYAEGNTIPGNDSPDPSPQPDPVPAAKKVITPKKAWILMGSIVLGGLIMYSVVRQSHARESVSDLHMFHPYHGQTLARQSFAEGHVVNADTVWVVIHPTDGTNFWVQPPASVVKNHWRSKVYVGSVNPNDVGIRSEVRAFVQPAAKLHDGDVLHSWPNAELSTDRIVIIRGPQLH